MDFPGGTVVKNLPASIGDTDSILGSGRSPGIGNGSPLQDSCLYNFMDRIPAVHGVARSQTRLSNSAQHTHARMTTFGQDGWGRFFDKVKFDLT